MSRNKNIEELFEGNFRDYRVSPSPSVWKNIQMKLFMNDFLRFTPGKLNIYYLLLLLSLPAIGFGTFGRGENEDQEVIENLPAGEVSIREERNRQLETGTTRIQDDLVMITEDQAGIQELKQEQPVKTEKAEIAIPDSAEAEVPVKKIPPKAEVPEKEQEPAPVTDPVAIFMPSSSSGCAPLQVSFRNLSKHALGYHWDFGDGGYSEEAGPEYIFDEPGTYTVSLTVTAPNGRQDSYSQKLRVFDLPAADFEVESLGEPAEGNPVYFYNYTKGATKYLWNFGDGTESDLKEPVHFYEESKSYNISLKAWSPEGCVDSLIVKDALAPKTPEITFPTAFAPNPDGPTGGYYEPGSGNNMVFHPYTENVPVEYNLKIFNKKGNLIFESNDYRTGWDGYYMQELQPQGVYIYKAHGHFSNGKSFVRAGDITLIHRKRF